MVTEKSNAVSEAAAYFGITTKLKAKLEEEQRVGYSLNEDKRAGLKRLRKET